MGQWLRFEVLCCFEIDRNLEIGSMLLPMPDHLLFMLGVQFRLGYSGTAFAIALKQMGSDASTENWFSWYEGSIAVFCWRG